MLPLAAGILMFELPFAYLPIKLPAVAFPVVVMLLVVASKVMFPAVRPFFTLKFLVATVPYIPVCYVYLVPAH